MAKQMNQKEKLPRLAQYLYEQSDEQHPVTMEMLLTHLRGLGIAAERKSIYSDLETLIACGCDIERRGGKNGGYYVASRSFELAELKLLVDAVQSSRFITYRKSAELISKVEQLASVHQARALQRQVYVAGRVKTMNESIYYNVDSIHTAISTNRSICFKYYRWAVSPALQLEKQYGHDGAQYEVSPWALLWADENYYMIAFDEHLRDMRHYRVDKMENIFIKEFPRDGAAAFQQLDMAAYARRVFGMFHGKEETVTLRCAVYLAGVLHDRFGEDLELRPDAEPGWIRLTVKIAVSPQFYGWLCGLGADIAIAAPASAAQAFQEYLQAILQANRQNPGNYLHGNR